MYSAALCEVLGQWGACRYTGLWSSFSSSPVGAFRPVNGGNWHSWPCLPGWLCKSQILCLPNLVSSFTLKFLIHLVLEGLHLVLCGSWPKQRQISIASSLFLALIQNFWKVAATRIVVQRSVFGGKQFRIASSGWGIIVLWPGGLG